MVEQIPKLEGRQMIMVLGAEEEEVSHRSQRRAIGARLMQANRAGVSGAVSPVWNA